MARIFILVQVYPLLYPFLLFQLPQRKRPPLDSHSVTFLTLRSQLHQILGLNLSNLQQLPSELIQLKTLLFILHLLPHSPWPASASSSSVAASITATWFIVNSCFVGKPIWNCWTRGYTNSCQCTAPHFSCKSCYQCTAFDNSSTDLYSRVESFGSGIFFHSCSAKNTVPRPPHAPRRATIAMTFPSVTCATSNLSFDRPITSPSITPVASNLLGEAGSSLPAIDTLLSQLGEQSTAFTASVVTSGRPTDEIQKVHQTWQKQCQPVPRVGSIRHCRRPIRIRQPWQNHSPNTNSVFTTSTTTTHAASTTETTASLHTATITPVVSDPMLPAAISATATPERSIFSPTPTLGGKSSPLTKFLGGISTPSCRVPLPVWHWASAHTQVPVMQQSHQ